MSLLGSIVHLAEREAKNKIYGVVIGIVTDNVDKTDKTFRVRVRFPWLDGGGEKEYAPDSSGEIETHQSYWARIASFSAGEYVSNSDEFGPRGALFLPEIDDEVLIAFEHGDILRPVVIGRLWSDVDPGKTSPGKPNRPVYSHVTMKGELATAVDEDRPGYVKSDGYQPLQHDTSPKNDISGLRTRSGHVLVFNDNKDQPGIILRSGAKHRIELLDGNKQGILLADSDGNYVWLKSGKQSGDIEIKTKGNIKLTADKNIELTAGQQILTDSKAGVTTMHAKGNFTIKTDASFDIGADSGQGNIHAGQLNLKGKPINLN